MTTNTSELAVSSQTRVHWVNRTVLGIGLASLFSDWSHEIAVTIMPASSVCEQWSHNGRLALFPDGSILFPKFSCTDRQHNRL